MHSQKAAYVQSSVQYAKSSTLQISALASLKHRTVIHDHPKLTDQSLTLQELPRQTGDASQWTRRMTRQVRRKKALMTMVMERIARPVQSFAFAHVRALLVQSAHNPEDG